MVRSRVADFPPAAPTPRPTWDEAVRTFLEACRVSGQSPTSVQSKADSLKLFTQHCEALGIDPWSADTNFIQNWLAGQRNRLAKNTVRLRLLGLRVLCRYLVRRGWLAVDPVEAIPTPQQSFTPVQPYSEDDLRNLWRSLGGSLREAALFVLLLGGSLRASELCKLQIHDIDWERGLLSIHGKGDRWRFAALDRVGMSCLRAYVGDRTEGPVLLGQRGPLTRNGIGWAVRRLGLRAGVVGAFPHRFRHTFGTYFLEAGGGAGDLQIIFGHQSATVTQRYVAAHAQRRAVKAQRQYNPMRIALAVSEENASA